MKCNLEGINLRGGNILFDACENITFNVGSNATAYDGVKKVTIDLLYFFIKYLNPKYTII